ncbi:MAG: hypothetical protein JSU08_12020 [Acidobacteria bacterium]|nr:hypothetical protein [Acidobacteriota bacterium]
MSALKALSFAVLLVPSIAAEQGSTTTYVGIVTDSMCQADHRPMNVSPDDRCVRECVGDARTFKYALSDGTHAYLLSDQETPAAFAGKKVRVTGVLYTKTNIIKVEKIEAVR